MFTKVGFIKKNVLFPIKTCVLLNRAAEARRLGEQLKEARDRISKLSKHVSGPLEITLYYEIKI